MGVPKHNGEDNDDQQANEEIGYQPTQDNVQGDQTTAPRVEEQPPPPKSPNQYPIQSLQKSTLLLMSH